MRVEGEEEVKKEDGVCFSFSKTCQALNPYLHIALIVSL